jgi:thioredoxin reductase (NADPH)
VVVEKGVPGGQMATTERIENCPGCIEGSGAQIGEWMRRQATNFGVEWRNTTVTDMRLGEEPKVVVTEGGELHGRAVILAMGARPRKLGIPGEDKFFGSGVSVCATCDGPFTQGQTVAVIGGGDSAVKEGEFLTRFADKVIIMHRRNTLRAERLNQERAEANPKVEFMFDVTVERILGEEGVRAVEVRSVLTGERREVPVDSVYIYIGMLPNTELLRGQVELDEWGYIRTDTRMVTSIPGVFAVGDIRSGTVRQIVTAAADGAVAALSADEYLQANQTQGLVMPLQPL